MLKVGIIDSGLSATQKATYTCYESDFTGNHSTDDQLGHGSAVAQAILDTAGRIDIYSARIFHDRLACPVGKVTEALDWLVKAAVDIINMSFGMPHYHDQLQRACHQAIAAGVVLIASSPAQGRPVYPASYSGVIRATGDARCLPGEISWLDSPQADFGGYVGDPQTGIAGASLGCASVSGRVAALLQTGHDREIYQQLIKHSQYQKPEIKFHDTQSKERPA